MQLSSGLLASESASRSTAASLGSDQMALVHHWMEFFRGGEAVLEQFGLLFPAAPISILVYNESNLSPSLKKHAYHPSFLQNQAFLKKHFRKLLPLFPEIIQRFRVPPQTRFVLSTDASLIKGIQLPAGVPHVCYCHSPPRYLWGMEETYLESSSQNNWIGRALFGTISPRLRRFDWRMAQRVDRFIANSRCVQDRILKCYERESVVINPPVSLTRFDAGRPREDFYLVVSALVPYKCVQIAVDACTRLNRRLIIIGTGPEEPDLRRSAGKTITFLGWQSNDSVKDHYERCRAFLFPGIEDFGITPCEAQASGAPVIAFGQGGALETVRPRVSGLFFHEQTAEALTSAIKQFEAMPEFDPAECRRNVANLGPERFRAEMREYLTAEYPEYFNGYEWPADHAPGAISTGTEADEITLSPRDGVSPVVLSTSRRDPGHETPLAPSDPRRLTTLQIFEPGEGGVFRHVEGLVRMLLSRGVAVHLAYSSRRGSRRLIALAEEVRRSGGQVLNLEVINVPEFRDATALWRLSQFVRSLKPDIIHGHSSKGGALARVARLASPQSAVLYTPHAYYGMSREPEMRRFIYNAIETVLARVGDTINISADEASFGQRIHKIPNGRQRIIPNPVDTSRFQPPTPAQRKVARARLGLAEHHEVIGLVARTCWQKDPETAYLAIAHAARRHPNLRFVHVAWGKWKDYLLSLARENGLAERIQILDYQEDTTAFYHAIDALMVSSRYEAGWPFVVLEALACNLPVIATTCAGMSDLGHAGLSHVYPFAPEDRAGGAKAIETWLARHRSTRLACNHRSHAIEHFGVEACFGAVLDLYRAKVAAAATDRIPKLDRAGQLG
jgi:glycosyltransferase involved in cell wall biosynthesis